MPVWKATTVEVVDGSIVELEVDAIVNAANATLAGGGGVDGAIHRAAGPELKSACLALPQLFPGVRCRPGEVKVTPGFALPAKHVFHTVGPVWRDGESGEEELLARCYRTSFEEAERLGLTSLAFPAISTGAYGYPAHLAARVAASETKAFAVRRTAPFRVVFAVLGVAMVRHLERALTL
ncbi:MAG: macro domain-containing protein [Myxococcales bacterium]|nr:macro domain-containing protein [Myxococcales bacterium]